MDSAKEKEEEIKEKKKVNPVRKVYTSGVGKFIHPNMKKEARYSSLNIFYEIMSLYKDNFTMKCFINRWNVVPL